MKKYDLTVIKFKNAKEMENYVNNPKEPIHKIIAFYNSPISYKIIYKKEEKI